MNLIRKESDAARRGASAVEQFVIQPVDNSMTNCGCDTCACVDRDGKLPCRVCSDVYPYDQYRKAV